MPFGDNITKQINSIFSPFYWNLQPWKEITALLDEKPIMHKKSTEVDF